MGRLRSARRLSRRLYIYGVERADYLDECLSRGVRFVKVGTKFVARYKYGIFHFARVHKNPYQLARILCEDLFHREIVMEQNMRTDFEARPTDLTQAVNNRLRELHVKDVSLRNVRFTRPRKPMVKRPPNPEFQGMIAEVMTESERAAVVDGYYSTSSTEIVMDQMVEGMTTLVEKEAREIDYDLMFDMFCDMALQLPCTGAGELVKYSPGKFTKEAVLDQQVSDRSAGLLPVLPGFGYTAGDKKEMQVAACMYNLAEENRPFPLHALACKPALKLEVIKKGKKVRTIQVESYPDFQVHKHYFDALVTYDRNMNLAIGLSTIRGDFYSIFYHWFIIWLEHDQGNGWNEFCDWLDQQLVLCSDVKAWEANTGPEECYVYWIKMLLRTDFTDTKDVAVERLIRAIADNIEPIIMHDGDKGYTAPFKIASGSFNTAHRNSEQHEYLVRWVVTFVERHELAYGTPECSCKICSTPRIREHDDFGKPVSQFELSMMLATKQMGDDFFGIIPYPDLYDRILECQFGALRKTMVLKMFCDPGFNPDGAEFLRQHFYLDRSQHVYQIRLHRASERILAKLYHGYSKIDPNRFYAALLSAMYGAGYNKDLYDRLAPIAYKIRDIIDVETTELELQQFARKQPALRDLHPMYVPDWNVIVDMNADMIEPMCRTVARYSFRKYGYTIEAFDAAGR